MWMKMSMSVENFLGFITCGSKGFFFFFFGCHEKNPAGHYITAGQCTLSPPPNQKVLVSPLFILDSSISSKPFFLEVQ